MDRDARIRRRGRLACQRGPDCLGGVAVPRMDPAPQRRYPADRIEAVSWHCRGRHWRKGMMAPAADSRRLAPRTPRRLWLPFTVSVGALATVAFGAVTRVVAGHDGTAAHDPHVTAWMAARRTERLTSVLRVATCLGSTAVIVPWWSSSGGSSSCGDAGGSRWHCWPPPVCAGRQDQIRSLVGIL